MEYERVKEKVAIIVGKAVFDGNLCKGKGVHHYADQILKTDGILIKSDDQSLPRNPEPAPNSFEDKLSYQSYKSAQQRMLQPDSEGRHWVKVKPKKEEKA